MMPSMRTIVSILRGVSSACSYIKHLGEGVKVSTFKRVSDLDYFVNQKFKDFTFFINCLDTGVPSFDLTGYSMHSS